MFLLEAWDSKGTLQLEKVQVDIETPLGTQVHPSNLMTVTHFGHFWPLIHPWRASTLPYRPRSTLGWCQHAQMSPKSTLR